MTIDTSILVAVIPSLLAVGAIIYSAGVQGQRISGLRRDFDRINVPQNIQVTLAQVLVELRHINEAIADLKGKP